MPRRTDPTPAMRLDDTDAALYVPLVLRARWVEAVPTRKAAVAVAVTRHPRHGPALVVTKRSTVNGHTGRAMSHSGETVLFGGALHWNESTGQAALRELHEESRTLHLRGDPSFRVVSGLGGWVTESGFGVEGHLVLLPDHFADEARADLREVQSIIYLPLAEVYSAPITMAFHEVARRDRWLRSPVADSVSTYFESPTLKVRAPDGRWHTLWGLAGAMVARLRRQVETPSALVAMLS